MKPLMKFNDFVNSEINESRVTIKRRYTESHPAKNVYSNSKIKAKILEAIADGQITKDEFNKILQELNANKRWVSRNAHLFKMNEEGISLSKFGRKMFEKSKSNKLNEGHSPQEQAYMEAEMEFDILFDKILQAKYGWGSKTRSQLDKIADKLLKLKKEYTNITLD